MQKNILITALLFCFIISNYAQTVTGKIAEKNKEPIAYATIQVNANYGVLSNENGEFILNITNFKPTDSVFISYLGYQKRSFLLKDFISQNYFLEENIEELNEIEISNKTLTIKEIIAKVKENASDNYSGNNTKRRIFNRNTFGVRFSKFEFEISKSTLLNKKQIRAVNDSIKVAISPFLNKTIKHYEESLNDFYKKDSIYNLEVIKAIVLKNKKKSVTMESFQKLMMNIMKKHLEKDATYKVKTGLLKVEDSLDVTKDIKIENNTTKKYASTSQMFRIKKNIKNNTISKNGLLDFINKPKKYQYSLEGTARYDDEKIYIIRFIPQRKSAKYAGKMYINANDFAMVKLSYGYAKGKRGKSHNYKFLLGIKTSNNVWKATVLYKKNAEGKYALKMITQENGNYAYISRPLKFTKNKTEKSEPKKMLKLDFKFEIHQTEKKELYFVSEESIGNQKIKLINKKYTKENVSRYSSEIWKDYQVLSPIKEIKNYDTGK